MEKAKKKELFEIFRISDNAVQFKYSVVHFST